MLPLHGSILTGAVIAALAATVSPPEAGAAETARAYRVDPQRPDDNFKEKGPNLDLVFSGIFTLGIPYIVSAIVATESVRAGDQVLYAPIAGPWLDLASRQGCPDGSCDGETLRGALLVVDGVLQGAGALEIAAGFLFPVPHSVNTGSLIPLRIVPRMARTGAGLSAVGVF
jgi:hypothetical protein